MNDGEILIWDVEANGFLNTVTTVWCVVLLNYETGSIRSYVGDEIPDAIVRLASARAIIGHYVKGYDIPVILKLYGVDLAEFTEVIDTVELSRALAPWMPDHKLRTWGDLLGVPKGDFDQFHAYSPAMIPYCCQDVFLNRDVFDTLLTGAI